MSEHGEHLRVVARLRIDPEGAAEFIGVALEGLVTPTRNERNCRAHGLCQDLADPTWFALTDEWESRRNLETHGVRSQVERTAARLPPLAAAPIEVQRLRVVG